MASFSVDTCLKMYEEAKLLRAPNENDWRMAAAYTLPQHYASWNVQGPVTQAQSAEVARRLSYDTTAMRSLPKYQAILQRLITPDGMKWHGLMPSDTSLRRKYRVRQYFDGLTDFLFKERYHPKARFRIVSNELYMSLGVYGNGPVFIGKREATRLSPQSGVKYVSCHMKDFFVLVDDEGEAYAVFRRFWLNGRQFKLKFPDVVPPPHIKVETDKTPPTEDKYFEFVHYVAPRDDYDPASLSRNRLPWGSVYIAVADRAVVLEENGYSSLPYKMPRVSSVPGNPYGYSPAMQALAAIGGASQMKKTHLKQGNKAIDPPLLVHDDAVANGEVDQRPGALNPGGLDRQGRELIKPMRIGDFRLAETLLQDERRDIEDSFFVTLFQILTETPEMTATEVMERIAEKAALAAPTMGRLQTEWGGPAIEREIDIHNELGKLPPMPPELLEAKGEYEIVYTSPLAKSMYAEEVSGFMRAVEMSLNLAQATQDPGHLDHYNFDVAMPEITDIMAVPTRWMRDPEEITKVRADRTDQASQSQALDAAPAMASALKTVTEAGGRRTAR